MIDTLQADTLFIHADCSAADVLRFDWRGRSNSQEPGKVLEPYLTKVVEAARDAGRDVEMHFEALDYFNSSTVSAIIQFLRTARDAGTSVVLTFDGQRRWQRMSFEALQVFADEKLVFIDKSLIATESAVGAQHSQ